MNNTSESLFPDNLNEQFEVYVSNNAIPFRDLPLGDYKIITEQLFKTQDSRDCMILTLINQNQETFIAFVPDRLREELLRKPNTFNYLRNLGLKASKTTDNQYFDFRLA